MTLEAIHSGIDLSYVDDDARPQDDLFGHVNGRWLADYDIPADRATDGAFRLLADRAEEQVRDLIVEASRSGVGAPDTDEQRIGDLYASFMDDRDRRARRRAAAARRAGDHRRGRRCRPHSPPCSAVCSAPGVGGGTGLYVDTDSKNSTRYLLHLSQSGPRACPTSRTTATPQHAEILAAYPAPHRADVRPGLRSRSDAHADTAARILALETKIGRRALGRRQAPRRRPDLQPARVR